MEDEVDSIMAELGLTVDSTPSPMVAPVSSPATVSSNPSLMSAGPGGMSSGPGGMSSGPGNMMSSGPGGMSSGPGNMMSSGPGAMSSGPGGMSSGPGNMMSSGPGAMSSGPGGMSSGPGGMSSGPGGFQNSSAQISNVQKFTPDGRPVQFTGPPCAECGEMIIGKVLNALGNTYHPDHFVCAFCHRPFEGGNYIEHEGKPYCERDYDNEFSEKCAACGRAITDKCISALGKKYHPEHFVCGGCGIPLQGKPYKEHDDEPFCTTCKAAVKKRIEPAASICGKCKLPITGEFITIKGQRMHPEHYRCEECGCSFTGGNCHEYEGKLYCYEDYLKLLRNTCKHCHKPIVGRSVTAMGAVWHPEHFMCFTCKEPFAGSTFHEHGGNAYCEVHYYQLFGDMCANCNKVVGGQSLTFGNMVYHPKCFTCSGCDTALVGKKGVMEWEGRPMCSNCYGALPKDVRKKVEKKRKMEAKAKKAADKAARKN